MNGIENSFLPKGEEIEIMEPEDLAIQLKLLEEQIKALEAQLSFAVGQKYDDVSKELTELILLINEVSIQSTFSNILKIFQDKLDAINKQLADGVPDVIKDKLEKERQILEEHIKLWSQKRPS
ncbi:MAG: hypothetical protein K9L98_03350 [Candidatus Pacebacteria bacterium]|nr:hypothetical protein [Candidatus Paceibacterota bacterium]MCF7863015.1 hypothetical protein [Candidatus Paceibacterota bacterium]